MKRNYFVDEDYFKHWNNNMAYILGFIAADGNVRKTDRNGGVVEITIQERDKKILDFISVELSNNTIPLREIKINNKKYYRLNICRRKIVNTLLAMGVVERKSLFLKSVKVPKKYFSHFVRGFFDGDGYVRITKPKDKRHNGYSYENLEVTLTSTKIFLKQVAKELLKFYKNAKIKIRDCSPYYNAFCFSINSLTARYFCAWIYKNCNFCLKRKFDIFKQFYLNNRHRKLHTIRKERNADFFTLCGF